MVINLPAVAAWVLTTLLHGDESHFSLPLASGRGEGLPLVVLLLMLVVVLLVIPERSLAINVTLPETFFNHHDGWMFIFQVWFLMFLLFVIVWHKVLTALVETMK